MIGVLTHHWAKDGFLAEARTLLAGNGRVQSRAPGFVLRHDLESLSDASKISSLVVWESDEIYDRWKASPERAVAMAGAEDLWARPPESERFTVSGRLWPSA
jgi:heme-degrading monooxygenase HmoA